MNKHLRLVAVLCVALFSAGPVWAALNYDRLSAADIKKRAQIMKVLVPYMQDRAGQGDIATLTFEQLYQPLTKTQRKFLQQFRALDGKELKVKIPYQGLATGQEDLVVIKGQKIKIKGELTTLAPQFLPRPVHAQYTAMMEAMEKDIGRRLYIESGYRSSAYQLYLFVFYLSNHDFSIRETLKFVALPGYSEHGAPANQALDFINSDGINGEDNPQEFEDLPEFAWLMEHAGKFSFVLSYPKNSPKGITYEPWHWRYSPPETDK